MAARLTPSQPVPVFDLGHLKNQQRSYCAASVEQWQVAMETGGYACIVNHGMPASLTSDMQTLSRAFHQLDEKHKLCIKIDRHQRGYLPAQIDSVAGTGGNITVSEALVIASEHESDDKNVLAGTQFYGSNQWPAALPELRSTAENYLQAMVAIGKNLLPHWSRALDRPPLFLGDIFKEDYSYLRMVHYPARPQLNVLPSNAHVDAGFMTLMPKANLPGLQIQGEDGQWFSPVFPDTGVLVIVGAFLEHWSRGRFRAVPHRVVAHPDAPRFSLPCFINPSLDAELPQLTDSEYAAEQRPVTTSFGEFFSAYMHKTYQHFEP